MQQRCAAVQQTQIEKPEFIEPSFEANRQELEFSSPAFTKIFDELIQPKENQFANEPPEQQKFKKRRKRKQHQSPS